MRGWGGGFAGDEGHRGRRGDGMGRRPRRNRQLRESEDAYHSTAGSNKRKQEGAESDMSEEENSLKSVAQGQLPAQSSIMTAIVK